MGVDCGQLMLWGCMLKLVFVPFASRRFQKTRYHDLHGTDRTQLPSTTPTSKHLGVSCLHFLSYSHAQ